MRILVFGDSIAQGLVDVDKAGWANRLAAEKMKISLQNPTGEWFDVFNVSVSGDRSSNVLQRFDNEVQARIWREQEPAIIIAIGINNTYLKDNETVSTVEEYKSDMQQLLGKAREYSSRVLVVGLTPVDDAITNPTNWDTHVSYRSERIWEFEQVLRQVTEATNTPLVPLFEDFKAALADGKQLLADGVHPSSEGHEFIYQKVIVALDRVL